MSRESGESGRGKEIRIVWVDYHEQKHVNCFENAKGECVDIAKKLAKFCLLISECESARYNYYLDLNKNCAKSLRIYLLSIKWVCQGRMLTHLPNTRKCWHPLVIVKALGWTSCLQASLSEKLWIG